MTKVFSASKFRMGGLSSRSVIEVVDVVHMIGRQVESPEAHVVTPSLPREDFNPLGSALLFWFEYTAVLVGDG